MRQVSMAALFLAVLGAACATTDGAVAAKVPDQFTMPDGTLVVCTMESETGSHRRERICRSQAETSAVTKNQNERTMTKQPINTARD
jgi:carbonic anhydrase/acetyltransferase-like protein (isoleucine patch superfamily)